MLCTHKTTILCQFGPKICPSVQQLISQPILIHFWWELYQTESKTVGGYSLRQNRAHTYSHLKTQASSQEWGETHATTCTTGEVNQSTTQVPMKTRLCLFGDAGNQAMKSEIGQLHKQTVMKPKHSKDLTIEQRREDVAYLMFLKQKRCGMIKA